MQYCQQAVLDGLLACISQDENLRCMLGFRDQEVNHRLALKGSENGSLATLDLSEASDRVSNQHVRCLLADHFYLHEAVDACRSRSADVSGHGVIRLAKFASMGSALCFPMEAMVFLTMIFLGIEKTLNVPLDGDVVKQYRHSVRVYGDDIIIPRRFVSQVIDSLESFGIRVNHGKSFWNGKFRESCGKEYYDGHDVSITRVRRNFPTSPDMVQETLSIVPLRNQFYLAGMWRTTAWLDSYIRRVLKYFPNVEPESPVLGRINSLGYSTEKIDPDTQSPRVRGWRVSSKLPSDPLDGVDALFKCLLSMERRDNSISDVLSETESNTPSIVNADSLPAVGAEHLDRAGRPQVRIKLRMGPPY